MSSTVLPLTVYWCHFIHFSADFLISNVIRNENLLLSTLFVSRIAMGFLTQIRKIKAKEKEMRLLLLGLDNAGKTTVLKRIMKEDVLAVSPTFGFSIRSIAQNGYMLNVWDVGGQECLRMYWKNYFERTDGILWVIDSTDISRLQDSRRELSEILSEERLASAPLVVFANKQDIPGAWTRDRIMHALQFDELSRPNSRPIYVVSCSAYTGEGILEGLNWLVDTVASRLYMHGR